MGTALQLEQLSMRYTGMLGANTPSFPDARPRSDRFRCGGRERNFLAAAVIYRRGGNARQFCSAGSFSLTAAVGGCFSAACMAKCQPTRPHSPPPVHGLTLSGAAGVKAISCNFRL